MLSRLPHGGQPKANRQLTFRQFARRLDRISSNLDRLAIAGAVIALAIMSGAALWQTVARYLLDAPPIWTEEVARRAMVWAGMLGASAAFRAGANPTIFPEMLYKKGGVGHVLSLVRAIGVTLFVGPVLWFSVFGANMDLSRGFLGRSLLRSAEMIPASMIWFTAAVPVCLLLILIHLVAMLSLRLSGDESKDHHV